LFQNRRRFETGPESPQNPKPRSGFGSRKGLEGFSRGAQRRGRSGSGAPQSPVFCGKEAPLYGALKSKKCARRTEKSKRSLPAQSPTFTIGGYFSILNR
jgi:hypothetical protein